MEIVTPTPNTNGVSPFHNHDVREWSRIDNLTGALERARLETDHWSARTNNTAHKYNKVVDSRARSDAGGAVQQHARRQLEVFQSSVPGGRLQVIKSHTVSSSRWSSKSTVVPDENKDIAQHFEDLELSINPLDLSSQKSKASVGRSIGKRPPTRIHSRDEVQSSINSSSNNPLRNFNSATSNLHRVSRLCHQIHDSAIKPTLGTYVQRPPIHNRQSEDGVETIETEKSKPTLSRTKSSSSEDINLLTTSNAKSNKSIEDLEDLEQLQCWRRASKIRRSLQFPKQTRSITKTLDLPKNTGSVRKICEDLETGRRLNTALRGNNVDLEALDQILQSISNSSGSDKSSVTDDKYEEPEKDILIENRKQKRDSFVTVESLNEVKGRLRRTSTPENDIYKETVQPKCDEDVDDGIVTEDSSMIDLKMPENNSLKQSRVRSYVFGMETMMNKKSMLGTGSLESRSSKQFGGVSMNRNEDWYNRRKSYGFEQVHNQQESINSISKTKTIIDSSTDSGICRSSEIMVLPTPKKNVNLKTKVYKEKVDDYNLNYEKCNDAISSAGSVKRYTSIFENKNDNSLSKPNMNNSNKSYDQIKKINKPLSNTNFGGKSIIVPVKVQNSSLSTHITNNSGSSGTDKHFPQKRHSIAVEEAKYVRQVSDSRITQTSLVSNDFVLHDGMDDESMNQNRKSKKVEFCKTEVHFAADSGRVNIVETDDKPPPTNNFRRRRRHSATLQLLDNRENVDLPLLHFGDGNYEKIQFEVTDKENGTQYSIPQTANMLEKDTLINNTVTVSTGKHQNYYFDDIEDEQKEIFDSEAPKGILKNKPIKPKPYLLGDNNFFSDKEIDSHNSGMWGVKLKSVHDKDETSFWKSTVTLKNTLYDKEQEIKERKSEEDDLQMELQKILQNLHQSAKHNNVEECSKIPEKQNIIRIIHPPVEPEKSTSLLSHVSNPADDTQKLEGGGYSTKVNIGHGEATVVKESLDNKRIKSSIWSKPDNSIKDVPETHCIKRDLGVYNDTNGSSMKQQKPLSTHITTNSPVVLRKKYEVRKPELKTAFDVEKLSSPSLVGHGQNVYSERNLQHLKHNVSLSPLLQSKNNTNAINGTEKQSYYSDTYIQKRINGRGSPFPIRKLSPPNLLENKVKQETCVRSPKVLRNPRKSEMSYFGVKEALSPKLIKKMPEHELSSDKPDLLQITPMHKNRINRESLPVYENMTNIKVEKKFDSSILDELTKAADQILQAVNDYAEEANIRESMTKTHPNVKLDTISETKSWRHSSDRNSNHVETEGHHKTKRTSSTSSIDSTTDCRKSHMVAKKNLPDDEARKKKNGSETSSSSKAAIKARRLQRASSREALLQSRGSSSEDLPINVPVRKPRLCKKIKSTASGISNETDTGRASASEPKKHEDKSKSNERTGVLPEIRHKTAISTIRSTAEKSAMRDRLQKSRQDETKKTSSKRDATKFTANAKTDKSRSISTKEPINHRISTANIRKCHKSEVSSRG